MAKRRQQLLWTSGIAAALLAAAPLAAQVTPETVNLATPAPAPADGNAVGPPQLRDFNLNGTVTRPAEPAVQTPTPAPATRAPSASAPPASDRAAPAQSAPAKVSPRPAPATVPAPDRDGSAETVTLDLPPPSPVDSTAVATEYGAAPAPTVTSPVEEGSRWPWLLAALAAALAAAFLLWRKRQAAASRYSYAGASELAASPEPASAPPPLPRASPAPQPRAAAPPPRPAPVPPRVAPPKPAAPASDGLIVSTGLRPKLGFELHPIRAETDDKQGAALLFDVVVVNNGHAPARDVLVEATLFNAGPQQDEQIGQFFRKPIGKGERLPVIQPMSRISVKTRLSIPGDQMSPIEIDGRKLFVPLVAFNALYRWSGGEEQDSASFLVGRGKEDGGKMAPFRLDQGAKSWTGLGARPHSMGLQKQPA